MSTNIVIYAMNEKAPGLTASFDTIQTSTETTLEIVKRITTDDKIQAYINWCKSLHQKRALGYGIINDHIDGLNKFIDFHKSVGNEIIVEAI